MLYKIISGLLDYKLTLETILENNQCEVLGWEVEAVEEEVRELEKIINTMEEYKMNLEERVALLEKTMTELEKKVQPNQFVPEDSDGRYPELRISIKINDGIINAKVPKEQIIKKVHESIKGIKPRL